MPCAVISNFEKKTAKTARELSTFPKNTAAKSVQYAQKNLTTIQEISIVNVGNKKLGQILLDDLRDKTRRTGKDIEALIGG